MMREGREKEEEGGMKEKVSEQRKESQENKGRKEKERKERLLGSEMLLADPTR